MGEAYAGTIERVCGFKVQPCQHSATNLDSLNSRISTPKRLDGG